VVVELSILGISIGFVSGFFGIGGGTLLVPSLLFAGFAIKEAIGISVMQMVFSSIFGSYLNLKKGAFIMKDGILLGIGGFIGAQGSGFMVSVLPSYVLTSIFLFSVCLAIYKFFRAVPESDEPEIGSKVAIFFVGFFVGLIAISIGIGGGLFLTPILVGFLNYDLKKAIGMSLFFIIFSSLSGFISLSLFGHINYHAGLIVGLSSLVGVLIGVKYSHTISKKMHKKLLLALYFVILFLMLKKLYF